MPRQSTPFPEPKLTEVSFHWCEMFDEALPLPYQQPLVQGYCIFVQLNFSGTVILNAVADYKLNVSPPAS